MLALIAIVALSQTPQPRLFLQPNLQRQRGLAYAFFEFAPASGTGMGTACACTPLTGAKGETLAFTRTTSGTCLKGNTTSIAVGDLVTCAVDQPRVMAGGTGTGPLGLLTERPGRNVILQSESIDSATWNKAGNGVAAPTVTADFALAPDNTLTAERVQIPAAGIGQESIVYQLPGATGDSALLHVRGNGTSGTVDLEVENGATAYCVSCAYNATTYTPCVTVGLAASTYFVFGNTQIRCGGGARGAQDLIVWGAYEEASGLVGSYIKTTTLAVDRGGDVASFSITLPTDDISTHRIVVDGVQQEYSATVSSLYGQALTTGMRALTAYINGSQYVYLGTSTTHGRFDIAIGGSTTSLVGTANFVVGSPTALFGDYLHPATSATQRVCVDGACSSQTAKLTLDTGAHTLYIGGGPSSGQQIGAVVKAVKVVPSAAASATAWSSDSLSANSNAYTLYARNGTRVVDMLGVSGASIGGCQAQWNVYKLGRDSRLVIQCGINDIGGGSSGASVWTAAQAYIEAVQTEGVTVIVTNLMPFKGSTYDTAPHEVERLAFNSAMLTYCGSHAALKCVDANTAVWNAADHAQLNPAFDSGDHLHMNATGGQALADAISAVAP